MGLAIITVSLLVFVGSLVYWCGVGADRAEYKFCLKEYAEKYATDEARAFNYCYESTY